MKKIITLLLSLMVLTGCSVSPSSTPSGSNEPSGPSNGSSDVPTYVTVTFVVGEGVEPIPSQTVLLGGKFTKPRDPQKDEYIFGGWYTNNSYSSTFNFNISYDSDQTIYAKWDSISYEYYMYGTLNEIDVSSPSVYKQDMYHLSIPKEEDSNAIMALYNFHLMPGDDVRVIRIGNDESEFVYGYNLSSIDKRGYYDVLLYENDINIRFIRHDEWIIKFLNDNDSGDTYGSFTKKSTEGEYVYFELKDLEVAANQRLFLSYAWEYNPNYYFDILCENEWPVTNNEPWVKMVNISSALYPNAETIVYEFQKAAKYDITVCVRKDCTYNDDNMKVTFSLIDDSELIYQDGVYNLSAILDVWEDYVKGNNTYQVDLVTGMLSARMSYGSTKLIDISEEKFTFYIFANNREMPNTPQFKTFEITCPAVISNIKNQMISTQTQLASALYNVDAKCFEVTHIINIDTSVANNDALLRATNLLAKVGSNADVVFAYETGQEGSSLTYGAGYGYHSVTYTSDSKLHVFSVSCLSKEDVLNDTDKYGVVSDNVTNIYEQNLEFYKNAI